MKKTLTRWISSILILLLVISMELGSWSTIPVEAASNIKIGGIDIGYALGAYFSKNGKQCTCHGRHSCGVASDCNCKVVSGCCQCYGFALWVENKLFGYNDVSSKGNFTNYGSISAGNMNATNLKKLISKAPIGSHIRTGGSQHSMIITEKTDSGFTIIQANGSNNDNYSGYYRCRIGTTKYTWNSYVSSTYGKRGISFVKGREGIKPTSVSEFTKDTRYPSPFKGYPISTSGDIPVYDSGLSQYSNHYISSNDLCTIHEVYTNGYCQVTYPTTNGTFTGYAKKTSFIGSGDVPYSYKPEQNYTTYTRSDLKTTFGSVFTTDNCTVVASGGSDKYQLIYPISGGFKIGWIQKTSVTPSQLVTPILGYNASATERTPVYESESTLGGTKYGEIFVDDLCTLDSVNIDKNWIKVTYPVSSGTKTGYVYLNEFFPSFVGKNNIRTAKVSKEVTAYRKSDRKTTIGTIYPSDTITIVGQSGNSIQVLYPITEGSNEGKYKLGWILNSEIVKNLQRIAVTSNPAKTEYLEGESLNTEGLTVTAYYDDGSTANITSSCSVSGYDSTPGTKTVTVSYSGKESAYTVTVNMKSPVTLTITNNPDKTDYYVNEEFDTSGLRASATFDNNTTEDVSSEIFCTVEDEFETPGTKSITVQYLYNCKTVNASVTVMVTEREVPNASGKVSVASVIGNTGATVAVPVRIIENPGIIGINLSMGYDKSRLKLVKVEGGELLDGSSMSSNYTKNPYILSLSNETSTENIAGTGVLATAYFEILADAVEGDAIIDLTFKEAYDKDLNEVSFDTVNGKVAIQPYKPGDVNRDGQVKLNDAILLRRFVAGWDVEIDLQAADVNRDGQVKLNDAIILRRYVAGWDVELK